MRSILGIAKDYIPVCNWGISQCYRCSYRKLLVPVNCISATAILSAILGMCGRCSRNVFYKASDWVLSLQSYIYMLLAPSSGSRCYCFIMGVLSRAGLCFGFLLLRFMTWHVPPISGSQADQGRAATLQRRGRDAKGASAPQHRPLLWFLGVCTSWKEVHCTSHWTHDIRNTQNVSVTYLLQIAIIESVFIMF